jgi:hypothetical protein
MIEYVMQRSGADVETMQSESLIWAHHRTTEIVSTQTVAQHDSSWLM